MYAPQQGSPQLPRLSSRETPLTLILIGANVVTFLFVYFTGGTWLQLGLGLTKSSLVFPWTLVTWPLLDTSGVIGLLFTGLWVWSLGGSMERAWGTARLLKFFLATTLTTGVLCFLAMHVLPVPPGALLGGLSLGFSPIAVAWCWINRRETILFNYLFPIPALVIAAITVVLTFFGSASLLGNPFAGFFGITGCAAAWWWVRGGQDWFSARFPGKAKSLPNPRFADLGRDVRGARQSKNPLQRAREEKARQKRDQAIAEMFRNSGYSDEDK